MSRVSIFGGEHPKKTLLQIDTDTLTVVLVETRLKATVNRNVARHVDRMRESMPYLSLIAENTVEYRMTHRLQCLRVAQVTHAMLRDFAGSPVLCILLDFTFYSKTKTPCRKKILFNSIEIRSVKPPTPARSEHAHDRHRRYDDNIRDQRLDDYKLRTR
ncbi:hypothetical protein EVAR_41574_1 [Eumeta japonica]|uniref:Uncharacterized protein n=1 Tax=Eumeta variegata TaxID=151549 RepID=A0A4C1XYZ1_EUMVA|nr:hypothetical protein EVAR_41574_1 [Eumeta japonica]